MAKTVPCPECDAAISPKAVACPHCGLANPLSPIKSSIEDQIAALQGKLRQKKRAEKQNAGTHYWHGVRNSVTVFVVIVVGVVIFSGGLRQDVIDIFSQPLPIFFGEEEPKAGGVSIFEVDDQIDWVEVAGGVIKLNWTARAGAAERLVTLPSFEISRSEVTVAQYERCIEEGPCTYPERTEGCNFGREGFERHPVNCVTRAQARLFARWVRGRLPSEAEWEYVATSLGKTRGYPWGDETPTCRHAVLNLGGEGCGTGTTQPACSAYLGYSREGVCDLAGNVWEWLDDDFLRDSAKLPLDGTPFFTDKEVKAVRRGGGWASTIPHLSPQKRSSVHPETESPELGFRVVRRAPPVLVIQDAGVAEVAPPEPDMALHPEPVPSIDATLFEGDAGVSP